MVTSQHYHEVLNSIVPKEYEFLSESVLETITIVATQQPVNRATIAKFRGRGENPNNGIVLLHWL
ncbi:SMC-Scp complex subunit ScpB [Priestia filamentosa]|uniref:SMC-Scp complex subunit ScpB n=1 Tax=Priestia filamentosa TaxID=1402861 RepID=UPI003982081A